MLAPAQLLAAARSPLRPWLLAPRRRCADLKLCNTTSSRIGVAIGYQDPTGWTTEGWWNIAAQTCETLYKGTLSSRFYYIHAIDYDRGGEWAGKSVMCTDRQDRSRSGGFRTAPDAAIRAPASSRWTPRKSKDWTIRLTDPSEGGARAK